MIDWDLVEEYAYNASGIAFEGCHKIYVLMDTEQVAQMVEYEYDFIHTAEEMSHREMFDTLKEWFEKSCPLRFIEAVETKNEDTEFTTLIEQGATDTEPCEDCLSEKCAGTCEWDEEDEEDEEDEGDEE